MIRGTEASDRPLTRPPLATRLGRRKGLLILLSALTASAALAAPKLARWARSDRSIDAARLRLAVVSRGDLERDVVVEERVVAAFHPSAFSPARGIVTLEVRAGEVVVAGQVVARVASPELESELARESSALAALVSEREGRKLRAEQAELEAGEFIAVMGPSGSGKTTFLNVVGLLDSFDEGRYLLDGRDASRLSDGEMARLRNEKIGFIFQSFNLIPDLDVFDNVDVPLRYRGFGRAERRRRIEQALATVGLSSRLRHTPAQLSGGQQQRVAIARALAGEPQLLLADEPTGNLDSAMAREIMDLLEQINDRGTTILMVTHDPELAQRAHRQVHLLDGRAIDLTAETPVPLFRPPAPSLATAAL